MVQGTNHTFLVPIICERVKQGSTIYSDGFGAYYHLNKFGYKHHVVVHAHTFVTSRIVHTNGIESFWAFTKQLFHGRKGLPRIRYQLHLKEAEFRFNHRDPHVLRLFLRKILS